MNQQAAVIKNPNLDLHLLTWNNVHNYIVKKNEDKLYILHGPNVTRRNSLITTYLCIYIEREKERKNLKDIHQNANKFYLPVVKFQVTFIFSEFFREHVFLKYELMERVSNLRVD